MNLRSRLEKAERAVAPWDAPRPAEQPITAVGRCHRLGDLFYRVARRLTDEGRSDVAERFTRLAA